MSVTLHLRLIKSKKRKMNVQKNYLLWHTENNAIFDRDVFQEDILYDYTPKSFIINQKNLKAEIYYKFFF